MLLRGLVIGFSIAAPVGPLGVPCIRRTLADGRAAGFASGLGVATAETTIVNAREEVGARRTNPILVHRTPEEIAAEASRS